MPTKIQRIALWWMIDHGGEMMICTGYKTTRLAKTMPTKSRVSRPVIAGSVNVLDGLKNNQFIQAVGDPWKDNLYRITDAGRKAAGLSRPVKD